MMASTPWFSSSSTVQKTANTINEIPLSKLTKLLQRIVSKIHLKDKKPFSPEEEGKLQVAFSMSEDNLQKVLDTISFIFEQAVYYNTKPTVLQQQLQNIKLGEEQIEGFVDIWVANHASVNELLRKRTLVPKQLEDVNWQLRMQAASSDQSKLKIPNGILELTLSDSEKMEKLLIEFSKDELYKLFQQLEGIQRKLDELNT